MTKVNKKSIDKVLELKPQEKIVHLEAVVESLDKSETYLVHLTSFR